MVCWILDQAVQVQALSEDIALLLPLSNQYINSIFELKCSEVTSTLKWTDIPSEVGVGNRNSPLISFMAQKLELSTRLINHLVESRLYLLNSWILVWVPALPGLKPTGMNPNILMFKYV